MTIEITDTEDFSSKLAHFFSGMQKLDRAGIEQSPDYFESMVEDFLVQFEATTPAPAVPKSAGWVVVNAETGYIPFDFKGRTYETSVHAQLAVTKFLSTKDYGQVSDYSVREATYFG